jgi:hypothetical protein
MLGPLYPRGNCPRYPLDRRLGETYEILCNTYTAIFAKLNTIYIFTYIGIYAYIHTFREVISFPKRIILLATCFMPVFLHGIFFDPEDGGVMFFIKVG